MGEKPVGSSERGEKTEMLNVPYWTLPLRLSGVFAQAQEKKGQRLQCCPGAPTEIFISCMIW